MRIFMWVLLILGAMVHGAAAQTFTDPFLYCAAIGTIDHPDEHFIGKPPTKEAGRAFDVLKIDFFSDQSVVWRCFNHHVYACVQLNNPICGRADISRVPTREMSAFCRSRPNSDVIPLAVMGHEHPSMYDWACRQGVATATHQFFTPDARGYPPDLWKQLSR